MKLIALFATMLCWTVSAAQPNSTFPKERKAQVEKIQALIEADDAEGLSELIRYPLGRPQPAKDIKTKQEFIAYYPYLFDAKMKERFLSYDATDADDMEKDVYIIIVESNVWVDREGKICMLNLFSSKEQQAIDAFWTSMHPSIKHRGYNEFFGGTADRTVRLDWIDANVHRLVIWDSKSISEEPLVLLNPGKRETMHKDLPRKDRPRQGRAFTFVKDDMTYVVEMVSKANNTAHVGTFLITYKEGTEVSRERLEQELVIEF